MRELGGGQSPQFVVNDWQELLGGVWIGADCVQDLSDVAHIEPRYTRAKAYTSTRTANEI